MSIDPNKYNREQLNALARDVGIDDDDIEAAETKAEVVALIEGNDPDANADGNEPKDDEPTAKPAGVTFRVAGVLVDPNGKPVEG